MSPLVTQIERSERISQLLYTWAMSPPLELGYEKNAQAIARHVRPDHSTTEAYDIGVVMLSCQSSAKCVVNQRRANFGKAVCRHRHPNSAATDENSSRCLR